MLRGGGGGRMPFCMVADDEAHASPLLQNVIQAQEYKSSPISQLVENLSSAKLGFSLTPRRRLSLNSSCSSSGTPTPTRLQDVSGTPTPTQLQDVSGVTEKDVVHENSSTHASPFISRKSNENLSLVKGGGKFFHPGSNTRVPLGIRQLSDLGQASPLSSRSGKGSLRIPSCEDSENCNPLEPDHDSRDSGYGGSLSGESLKEFRFPLGLPPRKRTMEMSPSRGKQSSPCKSEMSPAKLHKEETSDGFSELLALEEMSEDADAENKSMFSLFSAPIKNLTQMEAPERDVNEVNSLQEPQSSLPMLRCRPARLRPTFQRSVSYTGGTVSSSLAADRSSGDTECLKRPIEDVSSSPVQVKRHRAHLTAIEEESSSFTTKSHQIPERSIGRQLQRCMSETEVTITRALHRSTKEPDLIGNFTKPHSLPLINGKHSDLKSIGSDTLADLICGSLQHQPYKVIDCRFPYEYEGGHIRNAVNLYTKDQVLEALLPKQVCRTALQPSSSLERSPESSEAQDILIFHCEFSSERGPSLLRFLRKEDRKMNSENYPTLHFPEIYILDGGYKAFHEKYPHLCDPQGAYRPMLHSSHAAELRHFKAKSKSWSGDPMGKARLRLNSLSFKKQLL
ncbi:unnamed protein product [Darwinula stevensoni]|uniref:M-phase inducer phosphatase n=1 Tax=Darwinula stevensoni TaxID=69355 RepID=A0A7R9A604_9CRUS|nr:unnamed protein product [Darwinula stevensoni]CAG0887707.1 unnamed protein product [Darwinula stevensoni]